MQGIWTDALFWISATIGITSTAVIVTLAFAIAITAVVAALVGTGTTARWITYRHQRARPAGMRP